MKHSVLGWETMSKIRTQNKTQTPYYPFVGAPIKPLPGATCGACGNYI